MVLLALPDWFGLPESTRASIDQCRVQPFWVAFAGDQPEGFASLSQTSRAAAEIHCMGVLPGLHRQGIGRGLMEALTAHAM
ncbi:MAG: GNAT family N-acetyltransferase [Eubacteriales bacterium]|nr:GNAT family N-acetyltransferase [Eubacteriales bacterium]MDD3109907.1 GNAT family N-acetyltransferase [Eubacteriales bacterium]MDD3572717.1 GNAT family N-acetyltransferase [Eubacteriales bacterium]MDD4133476.1 GNAT family N-acetyltransferase [Eubacteriales bacterium]